MRPRHRDNQFARIRLGALTANDMLGYEIGN